MFICLPVRSGGRDSLRLCLEKTLRQSGVLCDLWSGEIPWETCLVATLRKQVFKIRVHLPARSVRRAVVFTPRYGVVLRSGN